MPNYDYKCKDCESETQHFHSFKVDPEFFCTGCGGLMHKVIKRVNFSVKNTVQRRMIQDRMRREGEMRQELREQHLVEQITPVAAKDISEVYREVKANGSAVRDQMQKTMEQNAKKTKKKQKDWEIGANRRVAKRTIEARERKAAEEQAKRKIQVSS